MELKKSNPEWITDNFKNEVAGKVVEGIDLNYKKQKKSKKITKNLNIDELYKGLIEGNRTILSKVITIIESNSPKYKVITDELIKKIHPLTGNSIRIGITGPPGVGKSTFIESLGTFLVENNQKVAVLAVDPSSTVTKGSILGDKTRMENLSRNDNAYIRPSPSGGTLGGVAKRTKEAILACEAAGYNIILIETIGVGQSEITVRSLVDIFILLLLPGSGDELQGIKKGVVELADILVINKCDGEYKLKANQTKSAYQSAIKLLQSPTEGWKPKVLTMSALEQLGIKEVWSTVNEFIINTKNSGYFEYRRKRQLVEWLNTLIFDYIQNKYLENKNFKLAKEQIEQDLLLSKISPNEAIDKLINILGI